MMNIRKSHKLYLLTMHKLVEQYGERNACSENTMYVQQKASKRMREIDSYSLVDSADIIIICFKCVSFALIRCDKLWSNIKIVLVHDLPHQYYSDHSELDVATWADNSNAHTVARCPARQLIYKLLWVRSEFGCFFFALCHPPTIGVPPPQTH